MIVKAAEKLGLNPDEAFIELLAAAGYAEGRSAPSFACIANPVKAVTKFSAFLRYDHCLRKPRYLNKLAIETVAREARAQLLPPWRRCADTGAN